MTPTAPEARQSCSSRSNDNGSHRHKKIGCKPCELVPHPEYLNFSNLITRSKTAWKINRTGNKAADQTVVSCQCRSRYTHPFMAEYLTSSCRMSGEGCKKSSSACHGTDQNAAECTGRRKRSHICDKMTARFITQHKLVYRKILLNLRTLPPNRDPCYYVCHFKAIS